MRAPHNPATDAPAALAVSGLTKSFRGKAALHDIGFTVPTSSLTVLLGPAGAGKTTTLRIIAGLERADAGNVVLSGTDAGTSEPKDRDIAMIFDNLALYPNKTGFENIANPLVLRRFPKDEIERRVNDMAGTLRVAHVMRRLPKTMSGGERQRVALGRALVREPSLFLLDEPLSSLDAMLRIELRAELKRLQRELGYTFLLATPDFAEAMAVADNVVMLREGRVVQIADPQSLYDNPADRDVARFVGAPEINILPAEIDTAGADTLRFAGAGIPLPPHLATGAIEKAGAFEAGIRPEHLSFADPAEAAIRGEVIDIEPLGLKSTVTVRNEAAELRLVADAAQANRLSVGETVGLDVAGSRLLGFDRATGMRIG